MSILEECKRREVWEDFRDEKKKRDQLTKRELKELDAFLYDERYRNFTDLSSFPLPEKKTLMKRGSSKKRIVYTYPEEETWLLKLISHLLYRYDDKIPENCYSFRKHYTAKTAWDDIRKRKDIDQKYVLKLDIHDYFRSMDTEILYNLLKEIIDDDEELLSFFSLILNQDACIEKGEVISEKRGAMPGVPVSSFFANVYLKDLDLYFLKQAIPYLRYSDDILVFADSKDEIDAIYEYITAFLKEMKLTLNEEKYSLSLPGEPFEFLGFRYEKGEIDLSRVTVTKMKAKIRRKARSLYRKKTRKNLSYEKAARELISHFDRVFYDIYGTGAFTWIRFYFPVITTDEGLKEIDECMREYLRYLKSGRHYKGNYSVIYEKLKELGYTPVLAEYYRWKKENRILNELNQG